MLLALFVLKSLFLVVFLLFLRPCFNLNKIIFFFSVYGCFIECHFASLLFGLLWFVVFVFVCVASASTNLLFLLGLGLYFCEHILFFCWLFLLLLLFNFFCRFCGCLLLHFFHFFLSFFLFFILGFALLIAHFPLNSGWHLPGWLFVLCSNHAITNLLLLNKHFDILRDSLPLLFLIHHRNQVWRKERNWEKNGRSVVVGNRRTCKRNWKAIVGGKASRKKVCAHKSRALTLIRKAN